MIHIRFEKFDELYSPVDKEGEIQKYDDGYHVLKDGECYYICVTYEYAHYMREELTRVHWDKKELPSIIENYKYYYTLLMEFYRYITTYHGTTSLKWAITIPARKSDNHKLQQIRCSNLEDALFERDFLVKYDWDYDLLVEQIDDTENPYYDVNLPPYPQRKIKNLRMRDTHHEELAEVIKYIREDEHYTQREICDKLNLNDMSLRYWLRNYDTDWVAFRKMVLTVDNPFDVLKLKRHIYIPDLSVDGDGGE